MASRPARERYKDKISEEMEGLSEPEMEKIIKIIHLVKKEFLEEKKKKPIEGFKKAKGAWKHVNVEKIYDKGFNLHPHLNPPPSEGEDKKGNFGYIRFGFRASDFGFIDGRK